MKEEKKTTIQNSTLSTHFYKGKKNEYERLLKHRNRQTEHDP
jgi:hypothetical protein